MKELSLNILDILENSVHANAKTITLRIEEDTETKDYFGFSVEDDGKGMDSAMAESVFDPFSTTSTTKNVGLGLPLLKGEAEMCDGGSSLTSEPGKGTIVSFWFRHSHIDRPPLGDIASTVIMMFMVHSNIKFVYCHEVNGLTFSVSTEEMKDIFQDVPINQPQVLHGIEEYLQENLKHLYGG